MPAYNILFIIPPFGPIENYLSKVPGQKKTVLTLPYGVLSIIAYINKKNSKHNIKVLDCNKIILENLLSENIETVINDAIKEEILKSRPEFVGISALFNTSFFHLKMIKDIKAYHPNCFVSIGGGLATNMYEQLFEEFPEIDAICYGEGEVPFLKLLENESNKDISTLSLAWVTKESLLRNQKPRYDFVESLDEIPFIQLEYIDYKKYNDRSYLNKDGKNKIEISIHTSRGCPFNCVFCANGKLHGKRVRTMSTDRVIDTIKYYKNTYGLTLLLIEDDHFLYDRKRAIDILKFIAENSIDAEFPNGLSVYQINDEIANALNLAKVKLVTLAIESGSDYVLKEVIDKPLTVKKITEAVSHLKKYNIRIHAFLVIGIPGELDIHRKESLDFLVKLEVDWTYIFIATPIVGSRLYDICKKNNYIVNNFGNHVVTKGNITAPGIDPIEMEDYAYYMHVIINFLENTNLKHNRYDIAEEYFLRVLNSYPKEAIAHFMLSIVYKNKNLPGKYDFHYSKYLEHYDSYIGKNSNNKLWKELIETVFKR